VSHQSQKEKESSTDQTGKKEIIGKLADMELDINPQAPSAFSFDYTRRFSVKSISAVRGFLNKCFVYERKLLKKNRPELFWLILGCVVQLFNGTIMPATSIIFSEIYKIFQLENLQLQRHLSLVFMGILFAVAFLSFVFSFLNHYSFALSGSRLSKRIRVGMFESLLRQEVAFHDLEDNRPSTLTTQLATSASRCKGLTGDRYGLLAQAFGGIGFAIVFAFFLNWKLTLLMAAFVPIIFGCGVIAGRSNLSTKKGGKYAEEEAGRLFVESIDNIKTVVSLGREVYFLEEFERIYLKDFQKQRWMLHVQALFYSLSTTIIFFVQSAVFSFGFFLMKNDGLTTTDLFRIYSSMTFSSMILGRVYAQLPDQSKCKAAARVAFEILERHSRIDPMSDEGDRPAFVIGNIKFENVMFKYPSRPDMSVLNGFNLSVQHGKTNALVGNSGKIFF
jgi:ABC-type bacteriocin/lantibiotic exporter with double-glycine peptidase domain